VSVKFGVIGTSDITDRFLAGAKLESRFELAAVYSRSYERGKSFADKYGIKEVFTDFEAMTKSLDAVYIASPNSCHAEQAIYFMERGVHVLCEKPLCSNAMEARRLIKTAKENGVLLMEAMISTLNPNYLALRDNISKIGWVRKYFSSYCQYSSRYDRYKAGVIENAFKKELSGGALLDIGVYTIYPMVVLFGKPKSIKALGEILASGVDGAGAAIFEYDGMEAIVNYSKISDSYALTEVQGEEGCLVMEKINIPRHLWFIPRKGEKQELSALHCGDDYYYEIKDFIDLIESGKTEHPINSHENSLIVMEIMDEIRRQIGLVYPADKQNSLKMHYLIITADDVSNLNQFQKIFVEIDEKGVVKREIGFDFDNHIIHAYPSKKHSYGRYGIFDLSAFDVSTIRDSQLQREEFEETWEQAFQ
jgi:Predicted dehydrogenases and related proteins